MTERSATDPEATGIATDTPAASHIPPGVCISLLGWLWIGVLTIPMAIVAVGAIMAAINERRVGVIVVGGQWLWAVVLVCAVVVSVVRLIQSAMHRT